MDERSFEQLTDQAASGLKPDRELFLDVKQELRGHLEEKAEHFEHEGHSPEDSIDLAKKSFGSPLDVAAELLDANRKRMKFRSLLRIGIGALIVPLAIILALYVGYGRVAHFLRIAAPLNFDIYRKSVPQLPTLPFYGTNRYQTERGAEFVRQLEGSQGHAENIRQYWAAHRQDPDSYKYYAYYAIYLDIKTTDERTFVDAMRLGEKIEPQNALYNVCLAEYYLHRGIQSQDEKSNDKGIAVTDDMLDRRNFELGIAEFRKASGKPYMHTYQMEILRKRLDALPSPLFAEDYLRLISISASQNFPHLAGYRNLARKIPGCARILISQGRNAEAGELMDSWKPYTKLLLSDGNNTLIHALVTTAIGKVLTKEVPSVYDKLGERAKAQAVRDASTKFSRIRQEWMDEVPSKERDAFDKTIQQHGSMLAGSLLSSYGGDSIITDQELTPARMADHVLIEELFVQILMILLMLALLGTLLQGTIWLYKLRRAASVPLLLMLPAKELLRALLLGIALPMAVYWIYSRLPVIGGREFGWLSGMRTRFIWELCTLGFIMLWLPVNIVRRSIRKRCTELNIALPNKKEESTVGWKVMGATLAAIFVTAITICSPADTTSQILRSAGIGLAIVIMALSLRAAGRKHGEHGLYYGTLARSLVPVYALAIIFISLTIQPWLLYNEAKSLRQDKVLYGYLANSGDNTPGFTMAEMRSVQSLNSLIRKALDESR